MKSCLNFKEEYNIENPDNTQLHYIELYSGNDYSYRKFRVRYANGASEVLTACCREHARDLGYGTVISVKKL